MDHNIRSKELHRSQRDFNPITKTHFFGVQRSLELNIKDFWKLKEGGEITTQEGDLKHLDAGSSGSSTTHRLCHFSPLRKDLLAHLFRLTSVVKIVGYGYAPIIMNDVLVWLLILLFR